MKITMKDIALEAGVSLGTVSNVLNGKSGISVDKIEKVQSAVKKLGYQRNIQASQLKKGETNKIAIILPNVTDIKYSSIYESLTLKLQQENVIFELYLTYNQEERELDIIRNINSENYLVIISDTCLKNIDNYHLLIEKCIFIYRELPNIPQVITFDYKSIIDDLLQDFVKNEIDQFTFIKDEFIDWKKQDFEYLIKQAQKYHIDILFIEQDKNAHLLAFNIVDTQSKALFISSFEIAKVIYNAFYFANKSIPYIYTFYRNSFNNDNRFIQYGLDYDYISHKISEKIINKINSISITPSHFGFLTFTPNLELNHQTIHLLAIDNPSIKALKQLIPHFKKLTGIHVNIDTYSFSDIPKQLEKNNHTHKYDMVRIDMESLPYFAEDYFYPLNNSISQELTQSFPESIIKRFCEFQHKLYGVPFDPSMQMLFYRKDLFEDQKIRRLYYEIYKKELVLPQNFEDFNILLKFFQLDILKDQAVKKGSALIIDDEGTLASEFFVRYYAMVPSIFRDGKINLRQDIIKTVLQQLKALYDNAILLEKSWWKDEVKLLEDGYIAMLIVYINHFSPIANDHLTSPIGFTSVPHSRPLLGGGSLAILKQTEKYMACEKFMRWFLQNMIQEQYIQLGGMSVREDLTGNQRIIQSLPWLSLAKETNFAGIRENALNHHAVNLRKIETIIGKAVKDYLCSNSDETYTAQIIIDNIMAITYL